MKPDVKLEKLTEMLSLLNEGLTREEFTTAFKEVLKIVKDTKDTSTKEWADLKKAVPTITEATNASTAKALAELQTKIEQALQSQIKALEAKLKTVRSGYTPRKGVDYTDGKDAVVDYQKVAKLAVALIPKPKDGTDGSTEEILQEIAELRKEVKTKTGNTTRIGWGAHPITIYDGTTVIDKNARIINFGTNLTVSRNASGVITVSATATGITELTATGTINSVNTSFTFLSQPDYIFIDGVKYKENAGWTWDNGTLTATVTKAPDYSIWGEA